MTISTDFPGGNIVLLGTEGDTVRVERDIRDTEGDWFYWAFRVDGAAGRTLTFTFPSGARIGWHGPAVSRDGKNWRWLAEGSAHPEHSFTYSFGPEENSVYFAHHMLYPPSRFDAFCVRHGLKAMSFAKTAKGRDVPYAVFGSGESWIVLTSRHHACESTGTYVLEGVCETLLNAPAFLRNFSVLVIPFIDYDGVLDGDQGKNRKPHDHNRDYIDAPVYDVIEKLMAFGKTHRIAYDFDLHSPWHKGDRNDRVFFSHSTESMEERLGRFSAILQEETAKDPMPFEPAFDCGPNQDWNDETSPNSKNWFSRLPDMKVCVTMETPYFGLDHNRVSQDALLTLGQHFGRVILKFEE